MAVHVKGFEVMKSVHNHSCCVECVAIAIGRMKFTKTLLSWDVIHVEIGKFTPSL